MYNVSIKSSVQFLGRVDLEIELSLQTHGQSLKLFCIKRSEGDSNTCAMLIQYRPSLI